MPKNVGRNIVLILILSVIMFGIFQSFNGDSALEEELQYGEFLEELDAGNIEELTIQPEQNVYLIEGRLAGQNEQESFTSVIPYNSTQDLDQILETARAQEDLNFTIEPAEEQSPWTSMLFTVHSAAPDPLPLPVPDESGARRRWRWRPRNELRQEQG